MGAKRRLNAVFAEIANKRVAVLVGAAHAEHHRWSVFGESTCYPHTRVGMARSAPASVVAGRDDMMDPEIADRDDTRDPAVYKVRRRSDGTVLPVMFNEDDLREERRRSTWWI